MGKTTKKSASKVEAPKAVAAPIKPLKKGKREAEAPIGKEVASAKKQKLDVKKIEKKVEPKKTEKVSKKKVETSSDDDTSSESEELPKVNVVAKDKMEIDSDDSSSGDSSGLEEVGASKKVPAIATKNGHVAAAKKKEESSDESDSDDSSSDEEPVAAVKKAPAAPAKAASVASSKKKDESSDESDSETDESSSDEEAPSVPATKAKAVPAKKDESSSDESDSDDDSSSDEEVAVKKGPAAEAIKAPVSVPKKEDSSSEESDSDDDSSSDDKAAKVATVKSSVSEVKQAKKEDSEDDSSDDDSSEESEEEPQKKTTTTIPSKTSSSSDSSSDDEDESSEEEAQPAKTPKKKDDDVKMADVEKTPNTPFTPKAETDGSTTVFFGNMSYSIDKPDIHEFFKEVGTVVDIRFGIKEDQFRGYGHVEFSSAEEAKKALELNGKDLLGRPAKLDLAKARGAGFQSGGYESRPAFQKRVEGQTIFVRGLGQDASEEEVRSSLQEHFGKCGEITRVHIPLDYETNAVRGSAYIDFKEADAFNKALGMSGSNMGGISLNVEEARPRGDSSAGFDGGNRGRDGGRHSGGRDFGRGRSGGRDFGGRGGRSGGRDFGGRGRGGRDGGRGGRGSFNKPNITPSGKKTTFNNDE